MVVDARAARVVAQALGLSRPQDCGVATHCHHQAAAVIEARACEFLRSPPCRRVGSDAAALGAEDCGVGEPFTDIDVSARGAGASLAHSGRRRVEDGTWRRCERGQSLRLHGDRDARSL